MFCVHVCINGVITSYTKSVDGVLFRSQLVHLSEAGVSNQVLETLQKEDWAVKVLVELQPPPSK